MEDLKKLRSNLDQDYTNKKTKNIVAVREIGSPCECKKMQKKISNSEETIIYKFWSLGSY